MGKIPAQLLTSSLGFQQALLKVLTTKLSLSKENLLASLPLLILDVLS